MARTPSARADLLADDDPADRRRQHQCRRPTRERVAERGAERLGFARVLQDQRALEIAGAVQAGRQRKWPSSRAPERRNIVENCRLRVIER